MNHRLRQHIAERSNGSPRRPGEVLVQIELELVADDGDSICLRRHVAQVQIDRLRASGRISLTAVRTMLPAR